ncbi:MAG: RNA polymerase subunit sigma-24 [Pirellulales bacterium]
MDQTHSMSIPPSDHARPHFCTTRWTIVLQAGDRNSPEREQALAELLQSYWYPLYCYIRRRGHQAAAAEDLLQSFIARLLEKDSLRGVRAGQGRFRNFLLVALRNYLASESERAHAQKRGGNVRTLALDFEAADARFRREPSHNVTADRLFERDWALDVIEQTFARLAAEWGTASKQKQFAVLSKYLINSNAAPPYSAAASELGASEGAVKTAVHRLRSRFRQLLCEQVATTLGNDDLMEDEIRRLFAALSV